MQTASSVHKASDLSPTVRQAVEVLLGRVLEEDETVSVRAFRGGLVKSAPIGKARDEAFQQLRKRIDHTAQRAENVPAQEIDLAIDEAADYVRHQR